MSSASSPVSRASRSPVVGGREIKPSDLMICRSRSLRLALPDFSSLSATRGGRGQTEECRAWDGWR
jgi:hypothetical protein